MRVLVLGGTGFIGAAVTHELIARGHAVIALARSAALAAKLGRLGPLPFAGDIARPQPWTAQLPALDAVIHAACDLDTDMGAIDRRLLDVLLPALSAQTRRPRFIYTCGCWLFGTTGDVVATEDSAFDPLPAFAWMIESLGSPPNSANGRAAMGSTNASAAPGRGVTSAGGRPGLIPAPPLGKPCVGSADGTGP